MGISCQAREGGGRGVKVTDIDDDMLIDVATTCSNRGIALAAEVALRKKYPSVRAKRMQQDAVAVLKGKRRPKDIKRLEAR